MRTKYLTKEKMGFTLVELLVVIAIIGLLAAIGIPAILNAQRASRNATRLKQLEALRNAAADYYTRNNQDPNLGTTTSAATSCTTATTFTANATTWACVALNSPTTDTKYISVAPNNGYTLQLVTACPSGGSTGTNVAFTFVAPNFNLCKEGNGQDTLSYR